MTNRPLRDALSALLPEPKMDGVGTVTNPDSEAHMAAQQKPGAGLPADRAGNPISKAQRTPERRRQVHVEEFKSRGMSAKEAERLADEVMARDLPENVGKQHKPLKLSAEEEKKIKLVTDSE